MRLLALGLLCLLLASPALAGSGRCGDDVDGRAVPCDCGDVLVGSRTLGDEDPITTRVCAGSGLLVDVSAGRTATLALGGRVLAGSGRGFGVQVVGGGDGGVTVLGPGGVRGFEFGILATGGRVARIAGVTAAENVRDGFNVTGNAYTVSGCEALRNGRDGFALGGVGFAVEGNRALENGRYGFQLTGRDGGLGGTTGNEAAGNARDGFRVRGRGHDLEHAVATANGGHGVAARVAGGRVAGAVASANRGHGVRAAGAGLVASDNDARGNGGGMDVRGAGVRDTGSDCGRGAPCR